MSKRIGITTTVPHEIIVAAGHVPVDLNNLFMANLDRARLLDLAEAEGFPPSVCAWIKGIYAGVRAGEVDAVVAVLTGDCSNTRALAEVLAHRGVEVIPLSYPSTPEPAAVSATLRDFANRLGTTVGQAEEVRRAWAPLRERLAELDRLAWEENRVTSRELHTWLVSASDFSGDADVYRQRLDEFLRKAKQRDPLRQRIRLALMGVPPIFDDLFDELDRLDARVVFAEVPRQFAMPYRCADLVEQFCRYTYPYDLSHRLRDLLAEIGRRRVHGAINYLQSFCHRQIEDIVLRETLPAPVLALEGDRPGPLGGQALTRLEAFLEMLR